MILQPSEPYPDEIYFSQFAKGHFHINLIQKKFENDLIIGSSDFKTVFNIQLQTNRRTLMYVVKKTHFDQKSQFSETSPELDCNLWMFRFTGKENKICEKTDS